MMNMGGGGGAGGFSSPYEELVYIYNDNNVVIHPDESGFRPLTRN